MLCANSYQSKGDVFGISDNSATRLIYLPLKISLPSSGGHCQHSFLLLLVLQLQNRAYACLDTFPYSNITIKQLKVYWSSFGMSFWQLLGGQSLIPSSAQLCSEEQGQIPTISDKNSRCLKDGDAYSSIPAIFLPHKNHPEIAI